MRVVKAKYPNFRAIPANATVGEKKVLWDKNLNSALRFLTHVLPTFMPDKIPYEHWFDMKEVYVPQADYDRAKERLHPYDFERYSPSVDPSIPSGYIGLGEGLWKSAPLHDSTMGDTIVYN